MRIMVIFLALLSSASEGTGHGRDWGHLGYIAGARPRLVVSGGAGDVGGRRGYNLLRRTAGEACAFLFLRTWRRRQPPANQRRRINLFAGLVGMGH